MNQYIIYTDGSCKGNPGPGAAAIVITSPDGTIVKEYAKGYPHTTNNRMEMSAAIAALNAVPDADVTIITDSTYVYKGITEWIHNWKKKGWKSSTGKQVENIDLWQKFDKAVAEYTGKIKWKVVKGHAGNPGNERADVLAQVTASQTADSIRE
ncbi:MAG: ribonuclease HI [bacterium]